MEYLSKFIKIIACTLIMTACFTVGSYAEITVLNSNANGMVISYHPAEPQIDSLYANDKIYRVFKYDRHSFRNQAGAPLIPSKSIYFAAPEGITPAVEIIDTAIHTRSNTIIAPNPETVPDGGGFTTNIYKEDPSLYAMSGYIPGSFARLGRKNTIDGIAVWELILTPVLFDAYKSSVAISDSFNINISWGALKSLKAVKPHRIPDYVINSATFSDIADKTLIMKKAETASSPFASGEWYKITLYESGIYSITGAEMQNAGFRAGDVAAGEIHMYYGGGKTIEIKPGEQLTTDDFREIAIRIDDGGDGRFDVQDKIIFFGEALSRFVLEPDNIHPEYQNYPYAEEGENAYWILVSGEGTPKRMEYTGESLSENITPKTTYRELIHIEHENYLEWIDKYNIESGIEWFWESISSGTEQFLFKAPGIAESDTALLRIGFRNGKEKGEDRSIKTHDIGLRVNNEKTFSFSINTSKERYVDVILRNQLKSDNNMLYIWRKSGTPDKNIRLDWIELDYEKELLLSNNKLEFFVTGSGEPAQFKVANSSSATEIYDITDPFNLKQFSVFENGTKTITFQKTIPTGKTSHYALCIPGDYLSVSSISQKSRSTLRNPVNGADYIIITHRNFSDQANRLANWRSIDSQIDPLSTIDLDVVDNYDEYSWGFFDPAAIRDFLKYAWINYNPPVKYCCSFGDTTFKYKNLSENQAGKNFLPTYTYLFMDKGILTDDYFSWFDIFNIPYIAIGRLCANDREEATVLVDKIIEYERNPQNGLWHNRVLLIADDELVFQGKVDKYNLEFTRNIEQIDTGGYIPDFLDRKKMMLIEYPIKNLRKPEVTEDLIETINDGYVIINYIGHGNNDVLAHEYILRGSRDIERINNGAKLPLIIVFSCAVGQFDKPDNISLAEMLNLRKEGGCVAIIAATRFTQNFQNVDLNQTFYSYLFDRNLNPDYRIGYALMKGKYEHNNDSNSDKYILFGDPATRLMIPRYGFNVAAVDTLYRLQKLDISGNVTDLSENVAYEGKLNIKAYGSKIHKTYTVSGITVNYTMPGKTFFNGEIGISGENFTVSFVIPKDLQSDVTAIKQYRKESQIILFASGDTNEASKVLDDFYIGGIYQLAPEDITGPVIKLTFDGKSFDDGDYIRRQPAMTAEITDDSGINIMGNRGHNIKLLIDKTEVIVLTDRLKTMNGYSNGVIDYTLPVLSPGEHDLEFTAYDSYNNASKKSVKAQVVGSETGDITIQNLLNFPNPMGSDGTTFTFSLNDDARTSNIKIYSQSGRLVDNVKFKADYGFNQIYWKPPFVLANGVYFYKLSIVSINGRKSSKIEKIVVMR